MRHLWLGASLYVPATRPDLVRIGNRRKHAHVRSVIFCTEDAVRAEDVGLALSQLESALAEFEPVGLLRFVRVRNPDVLRSLLSTSHVDRLDGFVLPKVTPANLAAYLSALAPYPHFAIMVTLETIEVFDPVQMHALRAMLLAPDCGGRLLSLRIGGNDLLNLLGIRRPRAQTVYSTPLGATIAQLVGTFLPYAFNLTGPVFEYLDRPDVLAREVRRDLSYGLFGKTAIHPAQVPVIEAEYRVKARDLEMAESILAGGAPPVFRVQDAMCEPAVHRRWAEAVRARATIYGLVERREASSMLDSVSSGS